MLNSGPPPFQGGENISAPFLPPLKRGGRGGRWCNGVQGRRLIQRLRTPASEMPHLLPAMPVESAIIVKWRPAMIRIAVDREKISEFCRRWQIKEFSFFG